MTSGERSAALPIGPTRCLDRLGSVRRRWARLHRTSAASIFLASICVAGALLIAVDWRWRGERPVRVAMLAAFLACAAWSVRRFVLPGWRIPSADDAALLIEGSCPDMNGRLLTAVQLAPPIARERSGVSGDLYGVVLSAAEHAADPLDPSRVIPGRPFVRRLVWAWGLVLAVLLLAALKPLSASVGVQRLLTPWRDVPWPQRTRIELPASSAGRPLRVVRGGTLSLDGSAAGVIPPTGMLQVWSKSDAIDRACFDIGGDGRFSVRYRPVVSDLTVMLSIGDAQSAAITVQMVPPPEIVAIKGRCIYPEYTRRRPDELDDGNVQAVFGTEVELRITANKPIAQARLAWEDGAPQTMRLGAPEEPEVADTRYRVEASRSYRFHLADELGFVNEQPIVYRIEMWDNAYPRFEKTGPSGDIRVTSHAIIPITADISDDFEVTEVNLCYRTAPKGPVMPPIIIPLKPGPRVNVAHSWTLESYSLKVGASLQYWLEARDAGEHSAKAKWPTSRVRRLEIVDATELERQLNEQLGQVLDGLAQLERLQAECADVVGGVARTTASRPAASTLPAAAVEQTRSEKWRQDRIARTTAQLSERLEHVAEDYAISRIGEPARIEHLRGTAAKLRQIAGTDMPAIVLALDEAVTFLQSQTAGARPSIHTQPEEKH